MRKIILLMLAVLLTSASAAAGDSMINRYGSPVQFFLETEQGTLLIPYHTIQIGENNTAFNYRTQGGQDILFPSSRYQAGMKIADRHLISLLYQPLTIVTKVPFRDNVKIDDVVFHDGKDDTDDVPMELTYGFPFYRLTYAYDLLPDPRRELSVGAVIQLRNASIIFAEISGDKIVTSQNLGVVPALFIRGRYELESGLALQAEAAGIYASSRFINGADFEFTGSLLDASLRAGYSLKNGMEMFFSLRFIGGSAEGTSEYDQSAWSVSNEAYTANYLTIVSTSVGVTLR